MLRSYHLLTTGSFASILSAQLQSIALSTDLLQKPAQTLTDSLTAETIRSTVVPSTRGSGDWETNENKNLRIT